MAAKIVKLNESYSMLTDANPTIIDRLRQELTYFNPSAIYNRDYKLKIWNGRTSLFGGVDLKLKNGLIFPALKALGSDVTIEKKVAELYAPVKLDWKSVYITPRYKLAAHQIRLIETAIRTRRATLESATNSGKSLSLYVLTRAAVEAGRRVLIVVPSIMLVEQLMADFLDYSDGTFSVEGLTGTIKPKSDNCIVSTWQSAVLKDRSWLQSYDTLFIDECHMTGKGFSLQTLSDACINANFRIGVTGSVLKDKLLQKTIESCFGPVQKIVDSIELVSVGFSAQITAKTISIHHNKIEVQLDYFGESKVAAASEAKFDAIVSLTKELRAMGNNCLVLFTTIKACKDFAKNVIGAMIINGSIKTADRLGFKNIMNTQRGQVICATYGTMSQGVSVKEIDDVILGSPVSPNTGTSSRLVQVVGRVARVSETKKTATIHDPIDIFPHSSALAIMHKRRSNVYKKLGIIIDDSL